VGNPVDTDTMVPIQCTSPGCKIAASVMIKRAKLKLVVMDNYTMKGGQTFTGKLYFDGKTGPSGQTVTMTSDHPSIIASSVETVDADTDAWPIFEISS